MKIPIAVFCLLLCSTAFLFAQTAAEMDALLNTSEVNTALAARFVMGSMNLLPQNLSGTAAEWEAYADALKLGWIEGERDAPISLKALSFLVMNACGIKGGLLFAVSKNPRYAYREMRYRKIIQGRSDPSMTVSGIRLLQIIDRALLYCGESDKIDAELNLEGAVPAGVAR